MKKIRRAGAIAALSFLATVVLAAAGPVATAQETLAAPAGAVTAAGATEVVAPNKRIELSVNNTREVTLVAPVRDIIVGNPDIADVIIRSPTTLFVAGKTVGSTNLFLLDAAGKMIDHFQISIHPDSQAAEDAIKAALPDEAITVSGAGDALVLNGSATSDGIATEAQTIARRFVANDAQVINTMRIATEQQVLIKVSVSEVQKSALKELGLANLISPTTIGDLVISGFTGGLSGVIAGGALGNGVSSVASALVTGSALTGTPSGALFIDGPGAIDTAVRILEQHGLARNLAEPNLVAVSGEYATMLAGGEIPIPINNGTTGLSIEYKPFGVSLTFLPVVVDKGHISLKIATEVSAPTEATGVTLGVGVAVPAFIVRRATSTVELPSGGSIMLAGLLNSEINQSLQGVPGIMNIPVLGTLFRSTSFQNNETELVIVARAFIVQPTDPGVLALPTDGFAPASDLDRYLLGHLQNIYTNRQGSAKEQVPQLQGPIGYIIR